MTGDNPEYAFKLCDQRKSILAKDGHMLIVGGPGAGKTTIALLKARRRVLHNLAPEQRVLFLSFSNSAIRRIVESAAGILSDDIAGRVDIKTYHSFAWEILNSHGYLTSNKRRLKIVAAQDAAVCAAGLNADDWTAEQNRLYLDDGLVTYDQFAPRAAELLARSSAALECFCLAYPLILVDEFQDTDEDQWALVQLLSRKSEIIALGDADQRIYEWRPGVSEARLEAFADTLDCERFDFANENNRSPATGIAGFARSLLTPGAKQDLPDEISWNVFKPGLLGVGLHLSVREAFREAKARSGKNHPKIAVAARSKKLVRSISDALSTEMTIQGKLRKAVAHDVLIDQNQILLSARAIANILSTAGTDRQTRLGEALERIADMHRAAANPTNINESDRLRKWAAKCRDGKTPNVKCVNALAGVMDQLDKDGLTGSPTADWRKVRSLLEKADAPQLQKTAEQARFLRLLRRGSAIEQTLIGLWTGQGDYLGAEAALELAMLQEQLMDAHRETATVTVMNLHQLKGREYDAVVLVEDQYNTFRAKDQSPHYADTRRLLQVSLTRAREYVVLLTHKDEPTLEILLGG